MYYNIEERIGTINKFYSSRYEDLWRYAMNKSRGGDHWGLSSEDDAMAVVHETFIYHINNPDMFLVGYAWNKIQQMRKDYIRKEGEYNEVVNRYKEEVDVNTQTFSNTTSVDPIEKVMWFENQALLYEELDKVSETSSVFIYRFLRGDMEEGTEQRDAVKYFNRRMEKKYGYTKLDRGKGNETVSSRGHKDIGCNCKGECRLHTFAT